MTSGSVETCLGCALQGLTASLVSGRLSPILLYRHRPTTPADLPPPTLSCEQGFGPPGSQPRRPGAGRCRLSRRPTTPGDAQQGLPPATGHGQLGGRAH